MAFNRTTDRRDLSRLRILTIADQTLEKLQFDSKEVVHDEGPFKALDLERKQCEHLGTYPTTIVQGKQLLRFPM